MGFQNMNEIVHRFASAKGGRARKKKGLASLSAERRREIASLGGKTSAKNRSGKGTEQGKEGGGESGINLADVLGDIDE